MVVVQASANIFCQVADRHFQRCRISKAASGEFQLATLLTVDAIRPVDNDFCDLGPLKKEVGNRTEEVSQGFPVNLFALHGLVLLSFNLFPTVAFVQPWRPCHRWRVDRFLPDGEPG